MHIWVDDACPAAIGEILFRAAQRTGLPLTRHETMACAFLHHRASPLYWLPPAATWPTTKLSNVSADDL